MRILSLLASATEIICALGLRESLVGCSHECDFPPDIGTLPRVTAPKFRLDGRSYDIDQRIKAILSEGISIYRVDVAALRELKPDVIVTQVQCEVCAVSFRDVEAALREIAGYSPAIVSLNPNSLADVWDDIRRIAAAVAVPEEGEKLIRSLRDTMTRLASGIQPPRKPTVACIEWLEPLMAGGNWMPELVSLAGGINLFGEAGKHSPWMTFTELAERDPDIILFLPCGFDIARTEAELPAIYRTDGWRSLRAVQDGRAYILDGNQYFNRPGPRLVDSLEILIEIFHAVAAPKYQGEGWKRASVG